MSKFEQALIENGEMLVVKRVVDPKFELAAVVEASQKRSNHALLFENVKGSEIPVASNIYGSHSRLCDMIGAEHGRFCARWSELMATRASIQPFVVPVPEPADIEEIPITALPHVTWREKDGGPYISAGVFYARDPETGIGNLSFCRTLMSGNEMICCIDPQHDLAQYQRKAEARGEALDVAILINPPPEIFLAACASVPIDVDEMQIAAAIRSSPVPVRPGRAIDLDIPAECQIVIECRIRPGVRRAEGPFGEYMGYYGPVNPMGYVLDVQNVMKQTDAVFHGLLCGSEEDRCLLDVGFATRTYMALAPTIPGILDVSCNPMFFCTVVKIDKQYEGQARQVMLKTFAANTTYNFVCIVVDKDVDITDMREVFLAFVTRGRVDNRVMVIPDVPGFDLGPDMLYGGRLGIDATMPMGREKDFERARTPGAGQIDLADYIETLRFRR